MAKCLTCGEEDIEDVLGHKCPPEARPWRSKNGGFEDGDS